MKFISNVVIILVVIYSANSLPINKYYIEELCRQQFVPLSPDISHPIQLYLTRNPNTIFGRNYCILSVNTSEDYFIKLEGQLGQLIINETQSNEERIHLTFNSSITENVDIFETFSVRKLIVIIENDENITQSNNNLQTKIEIKAVFKHDTPDCQDSNEPCTNTEEDMDSTDMESSGALNSNYDCNENDCSTESFAECESYETNCRKSDSQNSGSGYLGFNQFLFTLCYLFWVQIQ